MNGKKSLHRNKIGTYSSNTLNELEDLANSEIGPREDNRSSQLTLNLKRPSQSALNCHSNQFPSPAEPVEGASIPLKDEITAFALEVNPGGSYNTVNNGAHQFSQTSSPQRKLIRTQSQEAGTFGAESQQARELKLMVPR